MLQRSRATRPSDGVLSVFGGLSQPWCKLIYFEGNAETATIVGGEERLPAVFRLGDTSLDRARQYLLLETQRPPRSITVVLGELMLHGVDTDHLTATARLIERSPALDVRIMPSEVRLPYPFELYTQPPMGEDPSVFVPDEGHNIKRLTGIDEVDYHQRMVDNNLVYALQHDESVRFLHSIVAMSRYFMW